MIYNISALGDINDDKELWGGKAVSISQLIKNGFKVPKGFVISTTVHQHFLGNQISVDSFELKLREFCKEYFDMKTSTLIFRSSANIEESKDISCCGVFESFIYDNNVSLIQNVQKVWVSLKSPYTKSYFQYINYPIDKIKMAVIVQEVKRERFSAVIQTYDIIHDKKGIILEYSDQDLDSVVSGREDAYTMYIDYNCDSNTFRDMPNINEKIIKQLTRDCSIAENIFGSHVEMEAQIGVNDIYYIQARNI